MNTGINLDAKKISRLIRSNAECIVIDDTPNDMGLLTLRTCY